MCAYFRNLSACTLAHTHTHAEGSWHDITSLIRRVCATANGRRGAVNQNNSFARVHARPASANSKELFSGLWCVCVPVPVLLTRAHASHNAPQRQTCARKCTCKPPRFPHVARCVRNQHYISRVRTRRGEHCKRAGGRAVGRSVGPQSDM